MSHSILSIIGSGGKIGTKLCAMLTTLDTPCKIILYCSQSYGSKDRLMGLRLDILNTNPLLEVEITDSLKIIASSDLVVCLASNKLLDSDLKQFSKFDSSGRLVQSFLNHQMITDISQQLYLYNRNICFLMVTNQVDMMCEIAGSYLDNVYGLTGAVDSFRLRMVLIQDYSLQKDLADNAHIITFHNSDMQIASDTLPLNLRSEIPQILLKCKSFGGDISKLQKTGLPDNQDAGAQQLPSFAIFQFIKSFLFKQNLIYNIAMNQKVCDQQTAERYGVPLNTRLSIISHVEYKSIKTKLDILLTAKEKLHNLQSIENLDTQMQKLLSFKPVRLAVIGKCSQESIIENNQVVANLIGGSASNVAQTISRLGALVQLFCNLGKDTTGQKISNQLQSQRIQVFQNHLHTQLSVAQLDSCKSCDSFQTFSNGSFCNSFDFTLIDKNVDTIAVCGLQILHNDFMSDADFSQLIKTANGKYLFLDLNARSKVDPNNERFKALLEAAKCVKASSNELINLPDNFYQTVIEKGKIIIITEKGKVTSQSEEYGLIQMTCEPLDQGKVVCTIGAGDAFSAGFLSSQGDLETRIRCGISVAQQKIQGFGFTMFEEGTV